MAIGFFTLGELKELREVREVKGQQLLLRMPSFYLFTFLPFYPFTFLPLTGVAHFFTFLLFYPFTFKLPFYL